MRTDEPTGNDVLLAAYRAAHYQVTGAPTPFVMRVGERSAQLASVHRVHAVNCSAFITAWNPGSVSRPEDVNRASQVRLETELTRLGVTFLAGIGQDPAGVWPGEPSVLALGVSRSEAVRLGRAFDQRAIVWSGETAIPELVILRAK
jgi:hypothetical protein